MKNWRGLYLPDGEEHLIEWMTVTNRIVNDKPTYQYHKLEEAVKYCSKDRRRTGIDIGAHCGLWSMHLCTFFNKIIAFEPITAHWECFLKNVNLKNVELYTVALGKDPGVVSLTTGANSSGDTWVIPNGSNAKVAEVVLMKTLDSFYLQNIDFIKIDCEGYELPILMGGENTIKEWYPVICVEQKPNHGSRFGYKDTEAVDYLKSLGYRIKKEMQGDFIMVKK